MRSGIVAWRSYPSRHSSGFLSRTTCLAGTSSTNSMLDVATTLDWFTTFGCMKHLRGWHSVWRSSSISSSIQPRTRHWASLRRKLGGFPGYQGRTRIGPSANSKTQGCWLLNMGRFRYWIWRHCERSHTPVTNWQQWGCGKLWGRVARPPCSVWPHLDGCCSEPTLGESVLARLERGTAGAPWQTPAIVKAPAVGQCLAQDIYQLKKLVESNAATEPTAIRCKAKRWGFGKGRPDERRSPYVRDRNQLLQLYLAAGAPETPQCNDNPSITFTLVFGISYAAGGEGADCIQLHGTGVLIGMASALDRACACVSHCRHAHPLVWLFLIRGDLGSSPTIADAPTLKAEQDDPNPPDFRPCPAAVRFFEKSLSRRFLPRP
ncbi:hypothetical protein PSAC2689_100217 [Paraburkholderia sacchari]